MRRALEEAPMELEGAKAAAEPTRAVKMVSFMLVVVCEVKEETIKFDRLL